MNQMIQQFTDHVGWYRKGQITKEELVERSSDLREIFTPIRRNPDILKISLAMSELWENTVSSAMLKLGFDRRFCIFYLEQKRLGLPDRDMQLVLLSCGKLFYSLNKIADAEIFKGTDFCDQTGSAMSYGTIPSSYQIDFEEWLMLMKMTDQIKNIKSHHSRTVGEIDDDLKDIHEALVGIR